MWWVAVGVYAVVVFILSVIPTEHLPDADVPYLDRVVHVCEYLGFAWLLVQAIRVSRVPERDYLLWAWIYATTYGLLIEMLQAMVPWRSADWMDALANAIGAAGGVWIGQRIPPRPIMRET